MRIDELKKNGRVWCWWLHRYLWYRGENKGGYKFEDIADVVFYLSPEQIEKLSIMP